jgi:hypothetical protein
MIMNAYMFVPLSVFCITACSCEAQEVFHKQLGDKMQIAVSKHAVSDWQKTNAVTSASDYILTLNMPDGTQQGIWTNRSINFEQADPSLNNYQVFDAMFMDNKIELCYLQGVRFSVEEISSPFFPSSASNVWRFDLANVPIVPGWVVLTNAVFGTSTNGIKTLTAQGTVDTVLVWEYRNHAWAIDSEASRPVRVTERVRGEYREVPLK